MPLLKVGTPSSLGCKGKHVDFLLEVNSCSTLSERDFDTRDGGLPQGNSDRDTGCTACCHYGSNQPGGLTD